MSPFLLVFNKRHWRVVLRYEVVPDPPSVVISCPVSPAVSCWLLSFGVSPSLSVLASVFRSGLRGRNSADTSKVPSAFLVTASGSAAGCFPSGTTSSFSP